eukprot:gene4863-1532_t
MPKPLPPGSWNERALDRVRKARSLTARSTKTSQTSCKRGGPVGHALSPEALVSSPDLGCVVSRYTPCKKQLEDDSWKITSPDEKRPSAPHDMRGRRLERMLKPPPGAGTLRGVEASALLAQRASAGAGAPR